MGRPIGSSILPTCSWPVPPHPDDPVPLPLVIDHHHSANPDQIRRVLASNTVPRLSSRHEEGCCWPQSPRIRCCLCAVGLLPALLLFALFAIVWLSEMRLL